MLSSADKLFFGDADVIFQQAAVHTAKGPKRWFNDCGGNALKLSGNWCCKPPPAFSDNFPRLKKIPEPTGVGSPVVGSANSTCITENTQTCIIYCMGFTFLKCMTRNIERFNDILFLSDT